MSIPLPRPTTIQALKHKWEAMGISIELVEYGSGEVGIRASGADSTAEARGPEEILDLVVSLADRQFEQAFIDEQKA